MYQSLNFPSLKESTASTKQPETRKPSTSKSRDRLEVNSSKLAKNKGERRTKEKKDVKTDVMNRLEAIRDSKQGAQTGHLKLHVIYTEDNADISQNDHRVRSSALTQLEKEEESPEKRIHLMQDKLKLNVQAADKLGGDPIVQNVRIKNLLNVHNEESRIEIDFIEQIEEEPRPKVEANPSPIITHQDSGVRLQFVHIPNPPKTSVPSTPKDNTPVMKQIPKESQKIVSKENKHKGPVESPQIILNQKQREQSVTKVEFGVKEPTQEKDQIKPLKNEFEKGKHIIEAEKPKPKLVNSTMYEPKSEIQNKKIAKENNEKEQKPIKIKENRRDNLTQRQGKILKDRKHIEKDLTPSQAELKDKIVPKKKERIVEYPKKKLETKTETKQEDVKKQGSVLREKKLVIAQEPPKQKNPDFPIVYRPAGMNSGSSSPKSPRYLSKNLREGDIRDPEPKRSGSNSLKNSPSPGSPKQQSQEVPKKKNLIAAWQEKKAANKKQKPAELKYKPVSLNPQNQELDVIAETREQADLRSITEQEEETNAHIRLSEQLVEEFENQFKGFAGIDLNPKSASSNQLGESNSKSIKMDIKHSQEKFVSFQQSSASKDSRSPSPNLPPNRPSRAYEPNLNRSPSPSYHEPSSLSILVSEDPKSKRSNSKESYQDRHSSSNRNSSRREGAKSGELFDKEIFYREIEKLGKSNALKEIKEFESS